MYTVYLDNACSVLLFIAEIRLIVSRAYSNGLMAKLESQFYCRLDILGTKEEGTRCHTVLCLFYVPHRSKFRETAGVGCLECHMSLSLSGVGVYQSPSGHREGYCASSEMNLE
ncbi:hypothetical protein CEXT_138811 [Caerostris extrusa]|uniref:Uncharacterized protein n=1 Tax=Caerostris extrusa TaxID=172846 RepID=A0AAV4R9E3_CAEEX|nr:hypothetical protein CEXT_138811 [Caerostris extrusa]